ncbi:MAG: 2-hydroxyacyl-CoA dehydratase family protein [Verrucomicrobiota bacterium]|jgi:benzoyl-CoA reductase/2-hydroxyglutaryl-CoA dehydratase subunit BcrC/BadD/HgdB
MDYAAGSPSAIASAGAPDPLTWFSGMIDHCCDYAEAAKAQGRPIVGILCEFTPREIILAAGAVPVCLCGGSAATIPEAEQYLPANLCPLIKSTFGYHVKGSNPFLNWSDLVVAETTCDGKKKMFELMGATRPMYVLELPQKADDPDALERWTHEVRKLKEHLEQRFHTNITDEKLREAIRLMNRERRLRRQLAALMMRDPPPLTGRQLIGFKSIISGIEADLEQYERAIQFFSAPGPVGALSEPGGRARHSVRVDLGNREGGAQGTARPTIGSPSASPAKPERKVRVLLTGVPIVHGAERVLELIEDAGAVVVGMENCTGLKPILDDVDLDEPDPLCAIARKYYHLPCSVMTLNTRRFEILRSLAAKFRPHCVIELVWQACLTYDIESFHVRKLAEEEFHLPYLKITTDYSPSDSARITARVEALLETVRARPHNR